MLLPGAASLWQITERSPTTLLYFLKHKPGLIGNQAIHQGLKPPLIYETENSSSKNALFFVPDHSLTTIP